MRAEQICRLGALTALAAGAVAFGMLVIALVTGVDQQPFEELSAVGAMTERLLAADVGLRLTLTFDNLFVVFYSATFVLLATHLMAPGNRLVLGAALGALLLAALLDFRENHHILTMLRSAQQGLPIAAQEIHDRAAESQLKFHSSYLGLFLLGLAFPSRRLPEAAIRYSLIFVLLPVGILVYTFPHPLFELVRFAFFVIGLMLLAWSFTAWRRAATHSPVPAAG